MARIIVVWDASNRMNFDESMTFAEFIEKRIFSGDVGGRSKFVKDLNG